MRAVVWHGANDLRLEERPRLEPAAGEAVVRVGACGICGTDLRIASGGHRAYPEGTVRVPGHEIAGTVEAVGDGVELPSGATVFVAPNVGCGRCRQCRAGNVNRCRRPQALGITLDGAFADEVLIPADAVAQGNVVAADGLDPAAVAIVEPLACALRGQRPLAIAGGDTVLIFGAGPVGLMHLALARLREPGALIVVEPSAPRREEARRRGADRVVDPGADDLAALVEEASAEGRGADVVITAVPSGDAQRQALELAGPGGRVNFFGGLPRERSQVLLDTNLVHYKELLVTGTTASTNEDCREALELVTTGAVDTGTLVSERFGLDDTEAALEAAGSGRVLKVVLEP
jgi:L-iditol 2-dehydrogenase